MPASFWELAGSPELHVGRGSISARRMFLVPWTQHIEFIKNLWGLYTIVGNLGVITAPASYPGIPYLIPSDVSVTPFMGERDAPDGLTIPLLTLSIATVQYGFARVEVNYAPVQTDTDQNQKPEVPAGTFLHYSGKISNRMLTLPGVTFKWEVDDEPLDPQINVGFRLPNEEFTLRWERVPLPPRTAIRAKAGLINDDVFMGHEAGTVMFNGGEFDREFQIVDTGLSTVNYHFSVIKWESTNTPGTKLGWNYYRRTDAVGGENILKIVDQDGNDVFQETSFDELFEFE